MAENKQNKLGFSAPYILIRAVTGVTISGKFIAEDEKYGDVGREYIAQPTDFEFKHKDEKFNECSITIMTNDMEYFDIPALGTGMELYLTYGYVGEEDKTIRMTIMDKTINLSKDGFVIKVNLVDRGYYLKSKKANKSISRAIDIFDELEKNGFEMVLQFDGEGIYNSAEWSEKNKYEVQRAVTASTHANNANGLSQLEQPQPTLFSKIVFMYNKEGKPVDENTTENYIIEIIKDNKFYIESPEGKVREVNAGNSLDRAVYDMDAKKNYAKYQAKMFTNWAQRNNHGFRGGPQLTEAGTEYQPKVVANLTTFPSLSVGDIIKKGKSGKKLSKAEQLYYDTLLEFTPVEQSQILRQEYMNKVVQPRVEKGIKTILPEAMTTYYDDKGNAVPTEPFTPFHDVMGNYLPSQSQLESFERVLRKKLNNNDLKGYYRAAALKDFLNLMNESLGTYDQTLLDMLEDELDKIGGPDKLHVSVDGTRVTVHNRSVKPKAVYTYDFLSDDGIINLELKESNIVSEMKASNYNHVDPDTKSNVSGMSVSALTGSNDLYSMDKMEATILDWLNQLNGVMSEAAAGGNVQIPDLIIDINQFEANMLSGGNGINITGSEGSRFDEDTKMYKFILPVKAAMNLPYVKYLADNIARKRAIEVEEQRTTMNAVVFGNPSIIAGSNIVINNIPKKWSGKWYVKEVVHTITVHEGYITKLSLMILPSNINFLDYGISNKKPFGADKNQQFEMFGVDKVDVVRDYVDENGIAPEYDEKEGLSNIIKAEEKQKWFDEEYGMKGTPQTVENHGTTEDRYQEVTGGSSYEMDIIEVGIGEGPGAIFETPSQGIQYKMSEESGEVIKKKQKKL